MLHIESFPLGGGCKLVQTVVEITITHANNNCSTTSAIEISDSIEDITLSNIISFTQCKPLMQTTISVLQLQLQY